MSIQMNSTPKSPVRRAKARGQLGTRKIAVIAAGKDMWLDRTSSHHISTPTSEPLTMLQL